MNRKIIAIVFVAVMMAVSLAVIPADDSDADRTTTYTAHYVPDEYYYRNDTASFTYHGQSITDSWYADLTELSTKDQEFNDYIHGGAEFVSSELIPDHNYSSYWAGKNTNADKTFYVHGNSDTIYLNSGTYTLKIIDIKFDTSRQDNVSFVKANGLGEYVNVEYNVRIGGEYKFSTDGFNSFWFRSNYPFTIEYEVSGKSVSSDVKDEPLSTVSINNIYAWYKSDVSLSGKYNLEKEQIMFIKGSDDEKRFVSEVVNSGQYYSLSGDILNKYNSLKSGSYSGTFSVYQLYKSVDLRVTDDISKVDDSGKTSEFQTMIMERQTTDRTHLFSTAYSTIKVAVGAYDQQKYSVYLVYSDIYVPMAPNSICTIDNKAAKTYALVVENKEGEPTSLYMDMAVYTEGVPKEESNPDLFAIICIGLCVLIFGIVLISMKKPKWSKKKYDSIPTDKAAPVQQPPSENVPPQSEVPSESNEEAPKKGLFGRSKKE